MNENAVIECLRQKKEQFLVFERLTEQMLGCQTEELEGLVQERDKVIFEVDRLDERISNLCEEDAALAGAARADGNRGELDERLLAVFDAAMEARSVLSRLPETDLQAAIRLRLELKAALERIKDTNRGASAKASRFFSMASGSSNQLGRA